MNNIVTFLLDKAKSKTITWIQTIQTIKSISVLRVIFTMLYKFPENFTFQLGLNISVKFVKTRQKC